jgi:hypothetical protein
MLLIELFSFASHAHRMQSCIFAAASDSQAQPVDSRCSQQNLKTGYIKLLKMWAAECWYVQRTAPAP